MTKSGVVLSFFRSKKPADDDWTQQELAEFYRVEAALIRGGLLVEVDRGLTDEGDPWLVFCRRDNGEVIAHFARMSGQYVVSSSAFSGVARGRDFGLLLSELMRACPMALPLSDRHPQNVFLHPAAMLAALIATAFIIAPESDLYDQHAPDSSGKEAIRVLSLSDFTVLSAVAIATNWIENQIESVLTFLENQQNSFIEYSVAASDRHVTGDVALSFEPQKIVDEIGHSTNVNEDSHPVALIEDQSFIFANHLQPRLIDKEPDASAWMPGTVSEPNIHSPSTPVNPADVLTSLQAAPPFAGPVHTGTSASDQAIAAELAPVTSSDASQAVASTLASGNMNVPVVTTTGSLSLNDSIQQAVSHAGQVGNASPTGHAVFVAPTTAPLPDPSSPPLFDANANAILQAFMAATPRIEEDVVGKHVIVVDTNPADLASSHIGSQTWAFTDGSTLTIVGIIPTSGHMALHAA